MDVETAVKNPRKSAILKSITPKVCTEEPCLFGIDEAGRGPVLGHMVYGCSFCPISKKDDLKELGVADSKTLTEEKREELFAKLNEQDYVGWSVNLLSPQHISNGMLKRSKYSLNALSHDTAIGLIRQALDDGVNVAEVYVDTVGDPTKYEDLLKSHFPKLDITVAKKADSLYPIVSAASICAKVARDRALRLYKCEVDVETYGSGYPGDEKTKRFLEENIEPVFGFPHVVRFSWSTAATILDRKAAAVTWEDDDDEDDKPKKKLKKDENTPSVTSFFQRKPAAKTERKRHRFFTHRSLALVTR